MMPVAERSPRAYILAKKVDYFSNAMYYAWPEAAVRQRIHHGCSIEVEILPPPGVTNLGRLTRQRLSEPWRSHVLIGISLALLSPSPFVPLINPAVDWDRDDLENHRSWSIQHDGLKLQRPPYVYHVEKGDIDTFQPEDRCFSPCSQPTQELTPLASSSCNRT